MSINKTSMPVGDHLKELRGALIRSSLALLAACGVAFYFSDRLLHWLTRPLAGAGAGGGAEAPSTPLVFVSPTEVFLTDIKIALFAGLSLALPIILYEIGGFIAPGLIRKERRIFYPALIFASLSFYIGVAFAYFLAIPFALDFLISYGVQKGVLPQISIAMYIGFNLKFLFSFGLIFEFPIVMVLLSKTGLLTIPFLIHSRKYAIIAAFFIAAVLTPTPDIFNQCLMAIPLIVLYEIGILAVRFFGKSPIVIKTEQEETTS
jgi:sec-independent protein translocase protein TatC